MHRSEKTAAPVRYPLLDAVRGFAVLNMVLYHGIWDLVYLFQMEWTWYQSKYGYLWQQAICWTFISLSGFCSALGKRKLKRGIRVFGCGLLISAATWIFMPDAKVSFGILTFLGSCMLILAASEPLLKRIVPEAGLFGNILLFVFFRNVNGGYAGFEGWNWIALPECWYRNYFTTYLGFPMEGVVSTDYFSVFPWIFLFLAGYFTYRLLEKRKWLNNLEGQGRGIFEWIGKRSLVIYMIHQPVIYGVLRILF